MKTPHLVVITAIGLALNEIEKANRFQCMPHFRWSGPMENGELLFKARLVPYSSKVTFQRFMFVRVMIGRCAR